MFGEKDVYVDVQSIGSNGAGWEWFGQQRATCVPCPTAKCRQQTWAGNGFKTPHFGPRACHSINA